MSDDTEWDQANLGHLAIRLTATRLTVAAASADGRERDTFLEERDAALAAAEEAASISPPPAAIALAAAFGLSDFELTTLLLLALWELDRGRLRPYVDQVAGPTFGAAMAYLDDCHWSACTPGAPLRAYRLIECDPSDSITTTPIRIAEPVLHFLKGALSVDPLLTRRSAAPPPAHPLPDRVAEQVAELIDGQPSPESIQLIGVEWITLSTATSIATAVGRPARVFRVADLPARGDELDELRVLLTRDALLGCTLPIFVAGRSLRPDQLEALTDCLAPGLPMAIVATPEPLRLEVRGLRSLRLAAPDHGERAAYWRRRLGRHAERVEPLLDRIVAQFHLPPLAVDAACAGWLRDATDAPDPAQLWSACLSESAPALDGLAEPLPPRDGFGELVLPTSQREVLDSIVAQVRHRSTVDVHWKMQRRGSGIAVLFSGPSGTGKTLAAEGLAWELQLPLFRVDLSSVVSKYIGETEKHLSKLFDAAEACGAVLLFDEADALFGKRSEVSSAHDRYANIEVSYLLQRLETYTGLAVLTTNHKANIDSAFLRRIRFVVEFPTPGRRQRQTLWQRIFTAEVPVDGVDFERLAEFDLTGGSIRNAALVAASLAAEADAPVAMEQLLRAVRLELAKDGKSTHEAEA